jgi:antitoxin (DNA-binding transcriptional repressor) of toxin-antitoxin stability system
MVIQALFDFGSPLSSASSGSTTYGVAHAAVLQCHHEGLTLEWLPFDMRAVGIKALKNRLSEYVKIASGGETVLVTDRDRVVAELTPPQAGRAERIDDALLADAVRNGWLQPPVTIAGPLPPRQPVTRLGDLLHDLAADRAER